jgi:ribonuclease J
VVVTKRLGNNYRRQGREEFIDRIARTRQGISAKRLQGGRYVIMLRGGLIEDYQDAGVMPNADDAYNFSMWRGYLSDPCGSYYSAALNWLAAAGAEIAYIHTSGHASPADLRAFAAAVQPQVVVPVHGTKWDVEAHGFGRVCRLADGETMRIP